MFVASAALAKSLEIGFGWAVGKIADVHVAERLRNRAARTELVRVAADAVGAVADQYPTLGVDLGSSIFVQWVLAPCLVEILGARERRMTGQALAAEYADRFLGPYLRGRTQNEILETHFELSQDEFEAAFGAIVAALRPRLLASRYWRDPMVDQTIEEIRTAVFELRDAATVTPAAPRLQVDLELARADAREGATELRSWEQRIRGHYLERPEFATLKDRVASTPAAATLLVGPAGAGKSALLARLTTELEADGFVVFAIKADLVPADAKSLSDVSQALGMTGGLVEEIEALARSQPVVIIIDQLDAVSDVVDQTSRRMTILLQLANRWGNPDAREMGPPIHVVVSSRPFEAAHDARFQTLRAKQVDLDLPPYSAVETLISDLGIDHTKVPERLKETLRRPFRLKLFVDIALRGGEVGDLVDGELLNAWLASAHLGTTEQRAEVLSLMAALAEEMVVTETLWRPADRFTAGRAAAVTRAEACELLVRKGPNLGFAHQIWLDDFQARAFLKPVDLARHAWATQDGLFSRATILRALERLRLSDTTAYVEALDLLLDSARTRRHLRHLVCDLISTQGQPLAREIGWVQRLVRDDDALGRRAVSRIVERWAGWRDALAPMIPRMAAQSDRSNVALALGIAEARIAPEAADQLMLTVWSGPDRDLDALDLAWRAHHWSPVVRDRLQQILSRQDLADHWIAHFISVLADDGRAREAADLLDLFVSQLDPATDRHQELHGLEKVWQAEPLAFVSAVLPWFLRLVTSGMEARSPNRTMYPSTYGLPYDWQEDTHGAEILGGLQKAIDLVAERTPDAFLKDVVAQCSLEVEEVQAVVAEGFAAAGAHLKDAAVDWLLADPRRLRLGTTHAQDPLGVFGVVQGYSTGRLLIAIGEHLEPTILAKVVAAIEAWDGYASRAYGDTTANDRRDMRRWTEDHRVQLLAQLPQSALTSRRRRQVSEAKRLAGRPFPTKRGGRMIAGWVESRMSAGQMEKASDKQIFALLDRLSDARDGRALKRRFPFEGGAEQLVSAFARFGKQHPERALALAETRFQPGRHEKAAGALVRELSGVEGVDGARLLAVVRVFNARGFCSEDWRRDAAWALDNIAINLAGLPDDVIADLEAWIETDETLLADRAVRRRLNEQENRERNKLKEAAPPQAKLFGRGLDGFGVVEQGNNTFLSAMGTGFTRRNPPDHEAWLRVLERHVVRPEDPVVWRALLRRHGWSLHHAEGSRVRALTKRVWFDHSEALDAYGSHQVWHHRALFDDSILLAIVNSWLTEGEEGLQLAGEFASASALVDGGAMSALAARLEAGPIVAAKVGVMFGAAAVWRELDDERRDKAHNVLLPTAGSADGPIADAISTALDQSRRLPPDDATRELLECCRDNPAFLRACLNRTFVDALQELLLHPGFEPLLLDVVDRAVKQQIADKTRRGSMIDSDFVGIAIALQRGSGSHRALAMDLYETLLDAGAYGADEAAKAALRS